MSCMLGDKERNILTKSLARNSILCSFRPHGKILDCISHIKAKTSSCIKSLDIIYQFKPQILDNWELITGNERFPMRFFISPSEKGGSKLKFEKKKFSTPTILYLIVAYVRNYRRIFLELQSHGFHRAMVFISRCQPCPPSDWHSDMSIL